MSREVAIIGAGIVGMSVALELQRDGMQVTVFDPEEPGSGASFGNAGVIATELSLPIATPDVLRRVPRMLLDPYGPLVIRPFYLPRIATWLGRLALASRPGKMVATARALGALLDLALKSFRRLAADARADDLVIERGRLAVYATEAGYLGSTGLREEWQRRGVAFRAVSVGEVREMEPALAPVFMRGLFLPGGAFVVDPQAIVRRFARTLSDRGGRIVRAPVGTLRRHDGRRELVTPA
ncbi:MAG: FAD-binding oxidoreductase, partial [Microbacteriaceae bacterium]|nr:FAD-binding oxidoreductase [Microbacteriaceae bacterium]